MFPLNSSLVSVQFDENLILLLGGRDEKNSPTQDIVFFNQTYGMIEKASTTHLSISDKFTGGAMTQYVINRIQCRIYFASDAFVHEVEYAAKAGEAMFKSKIY